MTRLNSRKTCIFKPSPLDAESGGRDNLRRAVLGGVFSGDYQKVPRGNKRISLVWEAGLVDACLLHMTCSSSPCRCRIQRRRRSVCH